MPVPAAPLAQNASPPTPPGGSPRGAHAPRGPGAHAPAGGPGCAEGSADGGAHGVRAPSAVAGDCAGDVVRWAAFSCVLVPVVLVVYGSSFAGATGWAAGLAAITAVCRLLLRRSERTTAPPGADGHRGGGANGESSPLD